MLLDTWRQATYEMCFCGQWGTCFTHETLLVSFTVLKASTVCCYGFSSLYIVPYVVTMELIFTARLFATAFL